MPARQLAPQWYVPLAGNATLLSPLGCPAAPFIDVSARQLPQLRRITRSRSIAFLSCWHCSAHMFGRTLRSLFEKIPKPRSKRSEELGTNTACNGTDRELRPAQVVSLLSKLQPLELNPVGADLGQVVLC